MKSKFFQLIDHTADIGIQANGATLNEAFENVAYGMFSLITDIRKVRTATKIVVDLNSTDKEELLVEWLNELLFYFDTQNLLFRKFNIKEISEEHLTAICWGEPVDKNRHILKRGIKSATYHMLKVERFKPDGYRIMIILDI